MVFRIRLYKMNEKKPKKLSDHIDENWSKLEKKKKTQVNHISSQLTNSHLCSVTFSCPALSVLFDIQMHENILFTNAWGISFKLLLPSIYENHLKNNEQF